MASTSRSRSSPPRNNSPRTRSPFPSLLLPADFTEGGTPTQLSFFRENRQEKLAVICPESRQFIEIVPEKSGGIWQGALLLRRVLDSPFQSILELAPGKLLGAGESGFFPLDDAGGPFRIHSIERADDGFVLSFTEPLDRATGSKPESYSVQSIRLADGQRSNLTARPVIESDGLSVILRIPPAEDGTVLRVRCRNVTSESGVAPLNPSVFYTVHKR